MNANELYSIVKPAIIGGICGQTGLVTSFIEHAIDQQLWSMIFTISQTSCFSNNLIYPMDPITGHSQGAFEKAFVKISTGKSCAPINHANTSTDAPISNILSYITETM